MGITEILRRIWLFSANKIKSSEYFSKQPTQLIIMAHNCHICLQKYPSKSSGSTCTYWLKKQLPKLQFNFFYMQKVTTLVRPIWKVKMNKFWKLNKFKKQHLQVGSLKPLYSMVFPYDYFSHLSSILILFRNVYIIRRCTPAFSVLPVFFVKTQLTYSSKYLRDQRGIGTVYF